MSAIVRFKRWLQAQTSGQELPDPGNPKATFTGGPEQYAAGVCGVRSHLHSAVRHGMRDASDEEKQRLLRLLDDAAGWIPTIGRRCGDSRLPARLRALEAVLTAVFDGSSFEAAATAFEATVPENSSVRFDSFTLRKDDFVVNRYTTRLPLDRWGGWLVYDALWHLQLTGLDSGVLLNNGDMVHEETAILLVSDGGGAVLRLVVELLPGPKGLVTPDWWSMGLIRFPQSPTSMLTGEDANRDMDFVESTQRLLTAIARNHPSHRVRWRLEGYRATDNPGGSPISGRSAEAAVVCAGLAAFERLKYQESPVLNPNVAVTAVVDGDDKDVSKRSLTHVNEVTIPDKFRAAAEAGIREVLVARTQKPHPLPEPPVSDKGHPLRMHCVGTVDDAYLEIVTVNRYVRAYQEHVAVEFDKNWVLENSPAKAKG